MLEVAALLREELLEGIERIGGRLGELRFDTDLDISHGVVRYLELLKVAALMQRPPGQELADALSDVNARLLAAATPLQREILETSTLDESLLSAERSGTSPTPPIRSRDELSLRAFLPRRGGGLALSASDIQTYRSCPLRYKFARVLRIPTEQTIHQRFGIVVHQVLERYHSGGGTDAARAARAARCRLAPRRARPRRHGGGTAREGARGARPLPRAAAGARLRAGVVRAAVLLPDRPAPSARARRSRRPPACRTPEATS